ncbi:MAG TPA: hypothetical protein V6D11_00615 [Waterburya sp.]
MYTGLYIGQVQRDSEALLRSPLALPKASADRTLRTPKYCHQNQH